MDGYLRIGFGSDTDYLQESDFDRFTAYGYYQILLESLNIEGIAGLTYDNMTYPVNYRVPPVSGREDTVDQLSPKAGLIWTHTRQTSLRAAYSRSLGGVSFDQSFRLEPSQVAGINQAFRSVIPESVVGSTVAPQFDLWAVELDQRFPTRTYFAIKAELLQSEVDQEVGGFSLTFPPPRTPAAFQESLDYEERTLTLSLHQLLGDEWGVGSMGLSQCLRGSGKYLSLDAAPAQAY